MGWGSSISANLPYTLNSTLGAMLVIVLLLVTYFHKYTIDPFQHRIFSSLLVFSLAAITSDTLFLLFGGIPGRFANTLLYLFCASRYLFQSLSCYYVMVFIDYMAFKRKYHSRKILKVTYTILIVYASILLFDYIFRIDFFNIFYGKGRFYLQLPVNYSPLLFTFGELFLCRRLFKRSQVITSLTLLIFFVFGLTFDFLFDTARLIWPCVTAALLYAYFFIVQSYMSIDPLTEVGNRLSFNEFTDKLSRFPTGESWAIVMIDMDRLKEINDTLGHQEGDNALGYMAEIIKSCISRDDFAIRYGGDEFVLVTKVEKETAESSITKLIDEIHTVIDIFNEREVCPFKIEISYGYGVYTADGRQPMEEFLRHIDGLMYENKHEHRRSGDKKQAAAE
ncbi:MAG: GGDEF domain-containing protein [Treponema sp.]|jgi:diguanylate cyclase (GGDEF)-like protein|nr:GGDEF domain-containing protein [Treponema sp.]